MESHVYGAISFGHHEVDRTLCIKVCSLHVGKDSTPPIRLTETLHSSHRGLGDPEFKEKSLIICEPDVTSVALQPDSDAFSIQVNEG